MKKYLLFCLLFISLMACEPAVKFETKPIARFEHESVNKGVVNFTNLSSNYESSFWDFGDGSTSTERSPVHKFQKSGQYDVWLIVKDKKDRTSKFPQMIGVYF